MAKRRELNVALEESTRHKGEGAAAPIVEQEHKTMQPVPQSRQGKKTIAGHFDPAVSRQLKEIALAEDSSVQALLREALNDLFTKRGKPQIAS